MSARKRMVDGLGIWRSQKLRKVPQKYRGEYANLIPLAEVNGCFECDPWQVWSDVYSYNREDVTREDVVVMLDAFEKADMLHRYEVDGRVYATFVGIEKEGRLPGPATEAKYPNLPPLPPDRVGQNLPIDSIIVDRCEETFGFVEDRKFYSKDLKAAVKRFGYDIMRDNFELWVSANSTYAGKRPITTFLRGLGSAPTVGVSPNLQKVEDSIALRSNNKVFFHSAQKAILAGLVNEYGDKMVLSAFSEFFAEYPEDNVMYAAKTFLEQAPTRLRTVIARAQTAKTEQEKLENSLRQTIEENRRRLAAETEPEIEDNLE